MLLEDVFPHLDGKNGKPLGEMMIHLRARPYRGRHDFQLSRHAFILWQGKGLCFLGDASPLIANAGMGGWFLLCQPPLGHTSASGTDTV
jgi:hypothetical protein